jgi:rhodanese-related sulfurtransferase
VQATLAKHTKIIVGCQSGGRSQRAAEILASLGFRDVSNMQGGFGGARDQSGEVLVAGWQESGLPVETEARPGRSWSELASSR